MGEWRFWQDSPADGCDDNPSYLWFGVEFANGHQTGRAVGRCQTLEEAKRAAGVECKPVPFAIGLHEKVETLVLSFLRNGSTCGQFGVLSAAQDGSSQVYTVQSEGLSFHIATVSQGWAVRHRGRTGQARDLADAVRAVLQ